MIDLAAQMLLEDFQECSSAESKIQGGRFLLASVVLSAFAAEGLINVVGGKIFSDGWPERISWREKIKLIYSLYKEKPAFDRRPLQTIGELFRLRDDLAHPKMSVIEKQIDYTDIITAIELVSPNIMKRATANFAIRCREDIDAFRNEISTLTGVDYFQTIAIFNIVPDA